MNKKGALFELKGGIREPKVQKGNKGLLWVLDWLSAAGRRIHWSSIDVNRVHTNASREFAINPSESLPYPVDKSMPTLNPELKCF